MIENSQSILDWMAKSAAAWVFIGLLSYFSGALLLVLQNHDVIDLGSESYAPLLFLAPLTLMAMLVAPVFTWRLKGE